MIDTLFLQHAMRMLIVDEDCRPFPYDDVTGEAIRLPTGGNITIGIGRNLTDRGVSRDEMMLMFNNDLAAAIGGARAIFGDYESLSMNRQLGVVNLIFNLGKAKFERFKDTIAAIRVRDWKKAGDGLRNSAWYRQVKSRGPRVVKLIEEDTYEF